MLPRLFRFCLLSGSLLLTLLVPRLASAEVVPDATLPNNSRVSRFGAAYVIEGGTLRGNNLFHSFQEFSIPTGEIADFESTNSIANIFARVTGGSRSEIDGMLRASGTANLFLLNPNGILLGRNASLDIGGSFLATTANSFVFGEGLEFSAITPQAPPLLAINVPLGLQYGTNAPGTITSQASLNVDAGRSLTLLGGQVMLENSQLTAPGGQIELGSALGAGGVGLNSNRNFLSLNFSSGLPRSDISLVNGSVVNVASDNNGDIRIDARNLNISGNSLIRAGIASGQGSIDSQAGNVAIDATRAINIEGLSRIENNVDTNASGNAGNIRIVAGSLLVTNGANLQSFTRGQGNAGDITINARDRVSLDVGDIFSDVEEGAVGNGGAIRIFADSFSLTNGAQIIASTAGEGNAGSVTVNARDRVLLTGTSRDGEFVSAVFSDVEEGAVGNGGAIRIFADSFSLTNGASIIASTAGEGNAGSVTINARDRVSLDVGDIFSDVEEGAVGNGGAIRIFADSFSLTNGAQIIAGTAGEGNAGSVTINARDRVLLTGTSRDGEFVSTVFSDVEEGAVGNGGAIRIFADSFSLTNGAQIIASTAGRGNAGSVTVNVDETVSVAGRSGGFYSGIFNEVGADAQGNGGGIQITTGSLLVTDGAALEASLMGQGVASNIVINARDRVVFRGGSAYSELEPKAIGIGGDIRIRSNSLLLSGSLQLETANQGQGQGGNIIINVGSLTIEDGARLLAQTSGQGNAGSITVNARDRVSLDFGYIFSNVGDTAVGDGGAIRIFADSFSLTNGAQIIANTAGEGNAGNVAVNARDRVSLNVGYIFGNVEEGAVGNGGAIRIFADSFSLTNGASIIASTAGEGNA
ncbi:filamentous hemagglutinin N-terminal domain-containing protein, partial [Leptolyngbya sp. FACHB-541]|uniref:two-partner secretion domain-containing protein n=1 Tax=Leptolyngbya sp. FACHB-541 TaxID=2692810 RepID=UPI001684E5F4